MSKPAHILTRALTVLLLITGASCDNDKATDSKFSNSPTSGDLVVYVGMGAKLTRFDTAGRYADEIQGFGI